MRKIIFTTVAGFAMTALALGCQQNSVPPQTPPPATQAPVTPAAPSVAVPADATLVAIKSFAYQPATVNISAGGTVAWTNNDKVVHTVTANDNSFTSGDIAPGANFVHTFASAGATPYHCEVHSGMKGQVVVK